MTFVALRAVEKNARPRAHLFVYGLAPSLVLLLLLVLLVVLAPAWLPVFLVPLRHCTGFVLARCLLQCTGGCSNTYATAQAIDCGIVYCPAVALPDLFFSERLGAVAPMHIVSTHSLPAPHIIIASTSHRQYALLAVYCPSTPAPTSSYGPYDQQPWPPQKRELPKARPLRKTARVIIDA